MSCICGRDHGKEEVTAEVVHQALINFLEENRYPPNDKGVTAALLVLASESLVQSNTNLQLVQDRLVTFCLMVKHKWEAREALVNQVSREAMNTAKDPQ